ncbi:hypothetical protein AJ80_06392 [Polytolypa hystricis UAMH7299]|uniref:Uncharacterized protein n=1 Tax=Polytolypa hystricis (strain UAMH7299) TaxID=1447883 RepID=A0A2B7XXD0_POLH7|nr:hypothetical protein AJ80_06392 [Polytolypa hystricis UAMH7299]
MASSDRQSNVSRDGSRRTSAISFFERRLSRVALSRPETEPFIRDPLGLNLLYEPPEPRVDFIFVHGLGGGSCKTWSYAEDPSYFWPKEWLPYEEGFEHARIHSYGYNSLWDRRGDIARIHDFGQRLLTEIYGLSTLQRKGDNPIIFVGHSMGGVVIKKAYLLAKHDPDLKHIAKRFHTIVFLATPHRGSDSAQILRNLLRLPGMYGSKDFVEEVIPDSITLQVINDGFRHAYDELRLWSFFETMEMEIGPSRQIIVRRDSAILGAAHERVSHLDADHRQMAKFRSQSDSNYKILRTAFLTSIKEIEESTVHKEDLDKHEDMKLISRYFRGLQKPEIELMAASEKRTEGSCVWLTQKPSFSSWLDSSGSQVVFENEYGNANTAGQRLFWLSGGPGTGKSVISAHVINHIRSCGFDCSFYFFKASERAGSVVSGLLRSLAYQMASVNFEVRKTIVEMAQDGEYLSKDDPKSIWRTLFLSRIFRLSFSRAHYWVIDALDECKGYSTLFSLLSSIDANLPLKIFVTSRLTPTIERNFLIHKIGVLAEQITLQDSLADIELFLEVNALLLPVYDEESRSELITQIVEKSNGCFLWVALVLKELETAHSVEQMRETLDMVPEEMNGLYGRILEGIVLEPKNLTLAKAILRWVACAARPLTVEEMKEALHLDVNHLVPHLEIAIGSICGNLLYVDSDRRVQLVHQSLRSFLTSECPVSELAVDKRLGHSHIAELCLAHLSGKYFHHRHEIESSTPAGGKVSGSFTAYASHHFSHHLANSSPQIDGPILLLDRFLKSKVLRWIEIIAESGDLSPLLQTAKNFKTFLARRAKYRSPLGKEVQMTDSWANDLIRIVALFPRNLLLIPKSIHSLIPPVCPSKSLVNQTFGHQPRGLRVVGMSNQDWDDRLTCFSNSDARALSIATCDSYFAIGLANGDITVYRNTTFEFVRQLYHGQRISKLVYANFATLLVSSSTGKTILWDSQTGTQLWTMETNFRYEVIALSFTHDDASIVLATKERTVTLGVCDGHQMSDYSFYPDETEDEDMRYGQIALRADISADMKVIAITYRTSPVTIWDVERNSPRGRLARPEAQMSQPTSVAFNTELECIAVSYNDGQLILFDMHFKVSERVSVFAEVIAISPDGKTLATGDTHGTIYLFAFEPLRPIYRINADEVSVQSLVFSPNSLRFFDLRGDHCNVWEPPILVRKDTSDDASSEQYSEDFQQTLQWVDSPSVSRSTISAMVDHHEGDYLFCGRSDGSIAIYETGNGKIVQELFHDSYSSVHLLDWNAQSEILTAADSACRLVSRQITRDDEGTWAVEDPLLDVWMDYSIRQILTNPSGIRLLVSTTESDEIWLLDGEETKICSHQHQGIRLWAAHPANSENLLLIEDEKLYVSNWSENLTSSESDGLRLGSQKLSGLSPGQILSCRQGANICINYTTGWHKESASVLELWNVSQILAGSAEREVPLVSHYASFHSKIKTPIGIYGSLLLFLDIDGWICSLSIGSQKTEASYSRHFFIPFTWYSASGLIWQTTTKGAVALAHKDELIIFHGGIDQGIEVSFGSNGD